VDVADTYRFGPFEVHPAQRLVLREGQAVPMGARAFDVLLTLIERRDRRVTKTELLDAVWSGMVVEEANVQVQVATLRKLLGSGVISTIPGLGYRFSAVIERNEHDEEREAVPAARKDVNGAVTLDLKDAGTHAPVSRENASFPNPVAISVKLFDADYVITHDAGNSPIYVPCSGHCIRLVVEAASDQAVVLLAARPVVVSKKTPSGYLAPMAGIISVRQFALQLDKEIPRIISNNGGADFPFKVTKDDPEVFEICVETKQWHVSYFLELDWLCAGMEGVSRIGIAGVPFQCIAKPNPPSYSWDE
jgi:DNA-binding winged helix-turn-helix (wHTH) protein